MTRVQKPKIRIPLSVACIERIGFLGLAAFCLCLLVCSEALALEYSLRGFLQGNYVANTVRDNPDGKDLKWSEERVQLKLDASQGPWRLFVKEDAFYDNLEGKANTELREGYADYAAGSWDCRLGRQIITWGLGDNLFINDVFPKDYNAFFTGRPLEYLKKGIDGVKIGAYPGFASMELIVIPVFEPNTTPDSQRFWLNDPLSGVTSRKEQKPASTFENPEVALRLYGDVTGFDASLYFYKGYYRMPSVMLDNAAAPTQLTFVYPKLNVYGVSVQGSAWDGVLSAEVGYYHSREDLSGTNPLIPNSQLRYLIGYQRQLWEDFTLGLQYYGEYMQDYAAYKRNLPPGAPEDKHLRQLTSLRMTQLLLNQTLKLSFFMFYGLSDEDYLLNPEAKYSITDSIWLALGANVFGGRPWFQFGQLEDDDSVYLQVRYEF